NLVFGNGSTTQTNQWNFTVDDVPLIPPSHALAVAADTAFAIQMNKATNGTSTSCALIGPFGDNIARAERQLAGLLFDPDSQAPFPNEVANQPDGRGLYTETGTVNYEQNGNNSGFFSGDKPFPGITPNDPRWGNNPDHFAMSAVIKLQLNAGIYRMGVRSDDQFKVTTGPVTGTELYLGSS